MRALAVVAVLLACSAAAEEPALPQPGARDLCPVCGMLVSKYPHWVAIVTYRDGHAAFFDGATPVFQLVIPDFGVLEGPFQVTTLEYAGDHDGEATFEMSLASAGAVGFATI